MTSYPSIAFTPSVTALQARKGARALDQRLADHWPAFHGLTGDEIDHITERDSFYLATVSESGWPYVQHRGGSPGFVTVVDATTIGWVERTGNRQYIGTGNLTADDRVAAIFMDYPNRSRLKVYGRATYDGDPPDDVVDAFGGRALHADGVVTVTIIATSWNCAKYITPRYTTEQVLQITGPLRDRIADLERRAPRDATEPS